MDTANNEVGFDVGRTARNWDDIVDRARELMDQSAAGNGPVKWLPLADWRHSDTDLNPAPRDQFGNPIPSSSWNWPAPSWPAGPFPLPPNIPTPPGGNNTDGPSLWELEGWDHFTPISTDTSTNFTNARNWQPPRDPLVLDLDGDGIETVGIFGASGTGSPILFDHDADGTRTGTGWVAPDDALLVRDINGNGSIDSGRELFGDNTLLPNGQTATNGFTALLQHDANGDGQVNSQDAIFSQLRVWRDLNQDGVSQAGELQTLAQAGIASTRGRVCKRGARPRLRLKLAICPRINCVNSYIFNCIARQQ
jgi:hypothetical protein